ncbi:hypothetical protein D3C87_1481720 [compost metagenome]
MADPDIVADHHALGAAGGEEVIFIFGVVPIIAGTVGEMVKCGARHRMIGRVDADGCGDVDEFADGGAPDRTVLHDIGIVAHLHFLDAAAFRNFGIAADR